MRWLLICLLIPMACTAFSNKGNVPSPNNLNEKMNEERITDSIVLGGGCFWCLDAVYRNMKGIEKVECGYSNGIVAKPTYKEVCTGRTECVEVVKIFYDSNQTNLEEILTVFWRIHDPTTLNRQGNDVGTQYRSGIYFVNDEQKTMSLKSKLAVEESQLWSGKIVTEIVPLKDYSTAEDYHQDYFTNNPSNPYCTYVVGEKVEKFKKLFSEKIK
jgi:peptide-methionine (S)-S-oxide reductase